MVHTHDSSISEQYISDIKHTVYSNELRKERNTLNRESSLYSYSLYVRNTKLKNLE